MYVFTAVFRMDQSDNSGYAIVKLLERVPLNPPGWRVKVLEVLKRSALCNYGVGKELEVSETELFDVRGNGVYPGIGEKSWSLIGDRGGEVYGK